MILSHVQPLTFRTRTEANSAKQIYRSADTAFRHLLGNRTAIRANKARARLEAKSLARIEAGRKRFPLYRNGRMVVCHPDYNGKAIDGNVLGCHVVYLENEIIGCPEETIRDSRND